MFLKQNHKKANFFLSDLNYISENHYWEYAK